MLAREVEDLGFGEFTVIWALRLPESATLKPSLRRHFRAFVGDALASDAVASVLKLRRALYQPAQAIDMRALSDIEETVLWYLWASQSGDAQLANVLAFEVFASAHREEAHRASAILAFLLAEAGIAMPQPPLFECQRTEAQQAKPFEPRLARLLSGERLAVAAFRRWIAATQQKSCGVSAIARQMLRHGVGTPAAAALNHIMMVTQSAAIRPVQHKPQSCPMVSGDEARFLSALAFRADEVLAVIDWLPPAAQRICAPAFQGLRHYLFEAGLSVPKARCPEASSHSGEGSISGTGAAGTSRWVA
jgi:hypothetical protein